MQGVVEQSLAQGHLTKNEVSPHRSGFVAIIGRANVGKSTLLNQLLDEKLSIVSAKPHTTRHKLLGVLHAPHFQAALLDTPGYLSQERDVLDMAMSRQGASALSEASLVVLVVEPLLPGAVERRFMELLLNLRKPTILVVNKVDTVAKHNLLPVIESYATEHSFLELVPVSAFSGDGVALLVQLIARHLPINEPIFEPEMLTDRSLWFRMGEAVREQLFELYSGEVPYYVAVEVDDYEEREESQPHYVSVVVYVDKESQKRLLIGKAGQALKEVGIRARPVIEKLVGHSVFLELWVKVNPKWRRKAGFVQRTL